MSTTERNQTCEARIRSHLKSGLADFKALNQAAAMDDWNDLDDEDRAAVQDILEIADDEVENVSGTDARERAFDLIGEYPLCVRKEIVWRVDISTGGPGDWLEVFCDPDAPCYQSITRIVYHFNDWYDHAEQELVDTEFEIAEAFVQALIPDLS